MRTQITLVGYLGQDPKSNQVGEHTVVNFSVATNRKVKGDEITDWFNVAAWGKLGDLCQRYLARGRQVVVAGTFEPRTYESNGETRTSLDVRANEVHFIGERSGGDDRSTGAASEEGAFRPSTTGRDDENIPF
jgi:single-strand DNA-binding protein